MLPYDGFLLASADAARNPDFIAALADLTGRISDEVMREANRIVDVEGRPVSDAVAYLRGAVQGTN